MVPLTEVPSEFAGRIIVAKLGSAGIIAELRGVSRIYPTVLGQPLVWVEASEFNDARELIDADLDDALAPSGEDEAPVASSAMRAVLVVVAVVLLVSFGYGIRSCGAQPAPSSSSSGASSSR
jgi:hypothetical protein